MILRTYVHMKFYSIYHSAPQIFINGQQARTISRGSALARCRGFVTCGWKGVGTPQTPKASSRCCSAGTSPRFTCWGPRPHAPGQDLPRPRAKEAASESTDSEARRRGYCSTPPRTRREGRTRGLDTVARDHPSSNLMPRFGRAGRSLNRSGKPTERKPGARSGATQTARSPARDRWPDSVGHSSLGEAPDRPRGVTTRRPLRLDSDILAGRQLQQRARAPVGTLPRQPRRRLRKGAT